MTELLHADTPLPSEHPAPGYDSESRPLPFTKPSEDPLAAGARTSGRPDGHSWLDDALSLQDLAPLSTRQLRILSNHLFRLLDSAYPPAQAGERYQAVVAELGRRSQHAMERAPGRQVKETFRDNPLYCRFELYVDGTLAAYVKYRMNGGHVHLIDGTEQPGFRDQGLDMALMRHIVLNAHKRRLSILPRCPMAFAFLADNPQYQALAPHPTT